LKCPSCGSENVAKDALVRWVEETQSWALCGTFDRESCLECEAEGDEFLLRAAGVTPDAGSKTGADVPRANYLVDDLQSPLLPLQKV
jgi:hypothetical protein